MTIYLGSSGHIELQRPTTEWLRTTVNNSDINVEQRRFSVNFYGDQRGAGALADNPRRAAAVVIKQKIPSTTSSLVTASPSAASAADTLLSFLIQPGLTATPIVQSPSLFT